MIRILKNVPAVMGLWLLVLAVGWVTSAPAAPAALSQGQTVYVPVYSHIFYGDRARAFNLSVTLSIRNVDGNHPLEVTSVRYYDENGKLLKEFVPQPVSVAPMAATRFYIKESDVSGGAEASFLIRWRSSQKITPPSIGSVMVGTSFGQGISITTPGRVLEEVSEKKSD